jgi:hypothetical protein
MYHFFISFIFLTLTLLNKEHFGSQQATGEQTHVANSATHMEEPVQETAIEENIHNDESHGNSFCYFRNSMVLSVRV